MTGDLPRRSRRLGCGLGIGGDGMADGLANRNRRDALFNWKRKNTGGTPAPLRKGIDERRGAMPVVQVSRPTIRCEGSGPKRVFLRNEPKMGGGTGFETFDQAMCAVWP